MRPSPETATSTWAILFLALCSALDEAVTFLSTSLGLVELNPRVAWALSFNPVLYPLCDTALITTSWILDRALKRRVEHLWLIWAAVGISRLICISVTAGLMIARGVGK